MLNCTSSNKLLKEKGLKVSKNLDDQILEWHLEQCWALGTNPIVPIYVQIVVGLLPMYKCETVRS